MQMTNFNSSLKQVRKDIGMTQEELAVHSGVSRSYISQIETNYRQPTAFILNSLLMSMGHKLAILADDDNESYHNENLYTR
jgi:transcriptional regulator with XRE-family HTH domain|tara:strand:- start:193 stop:435 length:243 start_codon:yes stop_codon:yes gene_type:complete